MKFIAKYKWLLPALLFTLGLLAARMVYASAFALLFIPWNLFLAILPLCFAYRLHTATGIKAWALLALWLLFFPNAMYIVTDLFHLRQRGAVPLWYDLLLLLSAAITGIIMGFASLRQVEHYLSTRIPVRYMRSVLLTVFLLCGYGIYIGRYLRWNSWDVIMQPMALCSDIVFHVTHPFRSRECWLLTLLFGTWLYILYNYLGRREGVRQCEGMR